MLKVKILFISFVLMTLSACGGGGGDTVDLQLTYGSIAINQVNGKAGISSNYTTESTADTRALSECGDSCVVAFRFGPYQCGALARSATTATFGWASNSSKSTAEANAINECKNRGASDCSVKLSLCNG